MARSARPDAAHWAGRRVMVTGHTGFKGSWLVHWLARMGAQVHGLALNPEPGSHYEQAQTARLLQGDHRVDIRDAAAVDAVFQSVQPQTVMHLAAQALVRPGYDDPLGTLATNTLGTAHVLQACRGLKNLQAVLVVTTDKCYRNDGQPWPMRETDPLGGNDPYSASKACAELITSCFTNSFLAADHIRVATARAGNVIGGGDVCAQRLLPDAFRAWDANRPLTLRHPQATRPWQHVLDALGGYLLLAHALVDEGRAVEASYNLAPLGERPWAVSEVLQEAASAWGTNPQIETFAADPLRREASTLQLDASLAARDLGWANRLTTRQAIHWTVEWERAVRSGTTPTDATARQIDRLMALKEPTHDA
jgi:CDP-glucose 4,6-dehydratase